MTEMRSTRGWVCDQPDLREKIAMLVSACLGWESKRHSGGKAMMMMTTRRRMIRGLGLVSLMRLSNRDFYTMRARSTLNGETLLLPAALCKNEDTRRLTVFFLHVLPFPFSFINLQRNEQAVPVTTSLAQNHCFPKPIPSHSPTTSSKRSLSNLIHLVITAKVDA